jgi:hypothetical protein
MGRPSSQLHQFAGATRILKVWMHDFTLRNLPEILALGPMDADGKNIHSATGEKIARMSAYDPKRTFGDLATTQFCASFFLILGVQDRA